MVGAEAGLVRAVVPDIAYLDLARGGLTAGLSTLGRIALATATVFVLSRAGTRVIGRGGLVASFRHGGTAQARSGMMQHAIRANEGVLPGGRAE